MRDCCMNSAHFIVAFRACLLENISKKELYKGTNMLHHMLRDVSFEMQWYVEIFLWLLQDLHHQYSPTKYPGSEDSSP